MKVIETQQKDNGKVLVTLEMTKAQHDFTMTVGLGFLIQQGAMTMAEVPVQDFEDEPKVIIPEPAGEDNGNKLN